MAKFWSSELKMPFLIMEVDLLVEWKPADEPGCVLCASNPWLLFILDEKVDCLPVGRMKSTPLVLSWLVRMVYLFWSLRALPTSMLSWFSVLDFWSRISV